MGAICNKVGSPYGKRYSKHSDKIVDSRFRRNSKTEQDYLYQVYEQTKKKHQAQKITEEELRNIRYAIFGQDKNGNNFLFYYIQNRLSLIQEVISGEKVFNLYSGCVLLNEHEVMVCGGYDKRNKMTSNECYTFNLRSKEFKSYPDMLEFKYNFQLVKKGQYIYAIGGQIDQFDMDTQSTNSCERFDLNKQTWNQIASLNIGRYSHQAFIYNGQIYVLGGNCTDQTFIRKVEKYDEENNKWEIINFRLYQGFESANIIPYFEPNKFLVVGGGNDGTNQKKCYLYDFQQNTVLNKRPLLYNGNNLYCVPQNEQTYMIIGQVPNAQIYYVEKYDLARNFVLIEKEQPLQNQQIENLSESTNTKETIIIKYSQNQQQIDKQNYALYNILFGNEEEPFQLEMECNTGEIQVKEIPINLRLKSWQGCCRINIDELIFAGGKDVSYSACNKVYKYNLRTKNVQKLQSMKYKKCKLSLIKHNNFVYAIGGTSKIKKSMHTSGTCERLNLSTLQWETIGDLNIERKQFNVFIYQRKLMVSGGVTLNVEFTNTIEIFNENNLQWEVIGPTLPKGLSSSLLLQIKDQIIYFGGNKKGKALTRNIYYFDSLQGEFDCAKKLQTQLTEEVANFKAFRYKNKYIFFGCKKNWIDIFDTSSMDILQEETTSKGKSQNTLKTTKMKLQEMLRKISFDQRYFENNSFIFPVGIQFQLFFSIKCSGPKR